MDLVEFLTARYDEEQAALERIEDHSEPWRGEWGIKAGTLYTRNGWCLCVLHDSVDHPWNPRVLEHIVRYDPARIQADIASHRAVVDLYRANRGLMSARGHNAEDESRLWLLEAVLRRLAAPFREHPDFDPAWRTDD